MKQTCSMSEAVICSSCNQVICIMFKEEFCEECRNKISDGEIEGYE
jgi:hypothetical protein